MLDGVSNETFRPGQAYVQQESGSGSIGHRAAP